MGRNSIPKLGEWSGGHLYDFTVEPIKHGPDKGKTPPLDPYDGRLISFTRTNAPYIVKNQGVPVEEVLATCWADGFRECMASMYMSGYFKGLKAGEEAAKRAMREAMGAKE